VGNVCIGCCCVVASSGGLRWHFLTLGFPVRPRADLQLSPPPPIRNKIFRLWLFLSFWRLIITKITHQLFEFREANVLIKSVDYIYVEILVVPLEIRPWVRLSL
jgi:hypothetical protein